MDRIKHDRKKTAFKKDPTLLLKSGLRFFRCGQAAIGRAEAGDGYRLAPLNRACLRPDTTPDRQDQLDSCG
jgi:hypothetical protein